MTPVPSLLRTPRSSPSSVPLLLNQTVSDPQVSPHTHPLPGRPRGHESRSPISVPVLRVPRLQYLSSLDSSVLTDGNQCRPPIDFYWTGSTLRRFKDLN